MSQMSQDLIMIYIYVVLSFVVSYIIVKIMSKLSDQVGILSFIGLIFLIFVIGKFTKRRRQPLNVKNFESQMMMAFLKTSLN